MIHYNHKIETIDPYWEQGDRVILLGSQRMNLAKAQDYPPEKFFRDYVEIEKVDINGEDNSTFLDLAKSNKTLPKKADIVADYGTIEHVSNLINALHNTFKMLKVGGIGIHVNPLTGHFPGHNAHHYFTEEFWSKYIKLIGLDFIRVFTKPAYPPAGNEPIINNEVYAIYRKTKDSKFPARSAKAYKELKELIQDHIKKS